MSMASRECLEFCRGAHRPARRVTPSDRHPPEFCGFAAKSKILPPPRVLPRPVLLDSASGRYRGWGVLLLYL
jgi:hypothetical protein